MDDTCMFQIKFLVFVASKIQEIELALKEGKARLELGNPN